MWTTKLYNENLSCLIFSMNNDAVESRLDYPANLTCEHSTHRIRFRLFSTQRILNGFLVVNLMIEANRRREEQV